MKVECPVCGVSGILQQRGKSSRIQHYVGFQNGKRIYQYHSVKSMEVNGSNGSNGSKIVEVRKTGNSVFSEMLSQKPLGHKLGRLVS